MITLPHPSPPSTFVPVGRRRGARRRTSRPPPPAPSRRTSRRRRAAVSPGVPTAAAPPPSASPASVPPGALHYDGFEQGAFPDDREFGRVFCATAAMPSSFGPPRPLSSRRSAMSSCFFASPSHAMLYGGATLLVDWRSLVVQQYK